jgi:hypothetical protein
LQNVFFYVDETRIESLEKLLSSCEAIVAKFDEYGQGPRCERVCAALGVKTLDDLRWVKVADVEELKTD